MFLRGRHRCLPRLLCVRRSVSRRHAQPAPPCGLVITSRGCSSRAYISPESVVVEEVASNAHLSARADTTPHGTVEIVREETVRASTGLSTSDGFQEAVTVDTFARGRIANYLRRMGHPPAQAYHTRLLEGREKAALLASSGTREDDINRSSVYLTQLTVPLPAPHGSYLAEGLAEVAKDAELLAAMHAEQVCDALGVPLYGLPSMQKKHAEAARRAGREAPLPGDPVRPEGTPVPPPLRMLAFLAHTRSAAGTAPSPHPSSSTASSSSSPPAGHIRLRGVAIAEAELVTPWPAARSAKATRRLTRVVATAPPWTADTARQTTDADAHEDEATRSDVSTSPPSWRYADVAWYPWRHVRTPQEVLAEEGEDDMPVEALLAMVSGLGPAPSVTAPAAAASSSSPSSSLSSARPVQTPVALARTPLSSAAVSERPRASPFDPTEGGVWQMVQPLSTRCSPAPEDALVLPYVYEGSLCLDRLRVYYDQHQVSLEACLAMRHVAVARHAGRMYVAELRLVDVSHSVTAKGKAQTKEMALNLAAMHAELLLDAMGRPLFPKDPARQHRHAEAVKRFGRWAVDPHVEADTETSTALSVSGLDGDALPRPLKQQVGGDDVWLSLTKPHASRYTRTEGEHIVALHNVLSHHYSDAIEVQPPLELLAQAPAILRQWQLEVAENAYAELYVLTRLGDVYRATTLTPVPRCYGVRGGNATGKTMTQAVQLCALHALDTLSALGVPIYKDPAAQRAYMAWRRAHGFVTPDLVRGLRRPAFVMPLKRTIVSAGEGARDATDETVLGNEDTLTAAAGLPVFVQDALDATPGLAPSLRRPYLPSYIAEGSVVRLPPRIADTLRVLQLDIPEHFNVFGAEEASEVRLVEVGNAARVCVQNYIQHQHAAYRAAARQPPSPAQDPPPQQQEHEAQQQQQQQPPDVGVTPITPEEAGFWWRQWLDSPPAVSPHVFITGYTKQISVYNFAYLRLPLPLSQSTLKAVTAGASSCGPPSVLAMGLALKKKDAERMCFVHAAAMLHALADEDVLLRYPTGLPRQAAITSYALHVRPLITSMDSEAQAEGPTAVSYCQPVMYATMKAFLESGKYYVAPRRRNAHAEVPTHPGSF